MDDTKRGTPPARTARGRDVITAMQQTMRNGFAKLCGEMDKARAMYIAAAKAACSTAAEWEGEIDTVANMLRKAEAEQHGGPKQG